MGLKPQDLLVLAKLRCGLIQQARSEGRCCSRFYPTAPEAALADPQLHRLLALQEAMRLGRARERALASKLLRKELGSVDAD